MLLGKWDKLQTARKCLQWYILQRAGIRVCMGLSKLIMKTLSKLSETWKDTSSERMCVYWNVHNYVGYFHAPFRMAGRNYGQLQLLKVATRPLGHGRNSGWCDHHGKQLVDLIPVRHTLSVWPSYLSPASLPKEVDCCLTKPLHECLFIASYS